MASRHCGGIDMSYHQSPTHLNASTGVLPATGASMTLTGSVGWIVAGITLIILGVIIWKLSHKASQKARRKELQK